MKDTKAAVERWRQLLGDECVVGPSPELAPLPVDTSGMRRRVVCLLRLMVVDQIATIVRIASDADIALYPVSTGNNWGYGGANPVTQDCALVDLSGLDRVLAMDSDTGVVTIEPGVTQRTLREYLDARGLDFLVPVSGAGPDCSLIGNALERGYGITPYADHFGAVTRIEAVLADGSLYRSPLTELGGGLIDDGFKWGIGPYLDGLFAQGNIGIVTSMSIALAPRPERVTGFFFGVADDADLEKAVAAVRGALRSLGGVAGSINLMNRRRVLSMMEPYPTGAKDPDGLIPPDVLDQMARRNQVMAWTGAGALYGDARIVRAAQQVVRRELRGVAKRLVFFTPSSTARVAGLARRIPGQLGRRAEKIFGTLDKTLKLLAGEPSEIALPLAYWRSGTPPTDGRPMNPARDGCGLIWYSPLVPMDPGAARRYVSLVERVCRAHRLEPLITLTSLSDRCWDSTVPLLFDRADPEETARARACYDALFEAGRAEGFVPYRTHVDAMSKFVRPDSVFWQTAAKIKDALDPKGIIAPGRYSLR